MASVIVLPELSDSSRANSRGVLLDESASRNSKLPRSAASIVAQGPSSNARRAALTALSTSAAVPAATWAMTSPVAGLSVSSIWPSTGSTQRLSIISLV